MCKKTIDTRQIERLAHVERILMTWDRDEGVEGYHSDDMTDALKLIREALERAKLDLAQT